MAEVNQPANNLPARGGGAAGRGRGRGGNANAGGTSMTFLNPERAFPLISKYQKCLGKELSEVRISYTPEGISVELFGAEGTPYWKDAVGTNGKVDGSCDPISVAEFKRLKEQASAPSNEDAKFALRNKFEVRLNLEFPRDVDLGDGSEATLRQVVQNLPFEQRRVMLLTNKQYKSAYPNGLAGAAGAAA